MVTMWLAQVPACFSCYNAGAMVLHRRCLYSVNQLLIIEADFVDQFTGLFAMLYDLRKRNLVDFQFAEGCNDWINRSACLDRILVVCLCIKLLSVVRSKVFEKLDGFVLVWRILGNSCTADVYLRSAILEGWQDDLDAITPRLLLVAPYRSASDRHNRNLRLRYRRCRQQYPWRRLDHRRLPYAPDWP